MFQISGSGWHIEILGPTVSIRRELSALHFRDGLSRSLLSMALGQRSSRGTDVSNNGSHGPTPAHAITRYPRHLALGPRTGYVEHGRITHFFVIAPRGP